MLQTAEFVKIRLNGFLCRALIGPNLPGNIVLASVDHKMVCPSHPYDDQDLLNPLTRDLLRLNVARNSLSEVPSEALLQLKNLNQLDLSFNKIKVIAENTFAGE